MHLEMISFVVLFGAKTAILIAPTFLETAAQQPSMSIWPKYSISF